MQLGILNNFFIVLLFSLSAISLSAQEICDNGIDDDGNGQIDLNDEACVCSAFIGSSLIPNPSFEERSCCPNANEMLICADNWIQASNATSDYVHTCGSYLGNTSIPAVAPLPFPDGEGGIGFRDGQAFVGPNYKEYVGACLLEPMVVGETYRLDFFVGFQNNAQGSTQFNIAFFASTNCFNLPFGGNQNVGCPLNAGGYVQLAQQQVSGSNEWVNVVVEFVADQAYEVLVIGPGCAANPNYTSDPYFYADRLALEEVSAFGFPLESISGSVCIDGVTLTANTPLGSTANYQWYHNGVAIIGETNPTLILDTTAPEGDYVVSAITDDGCSLSQIYELILPPYYTTVNTSICDNESYTVGNENLEEAGYYEITIPASDGCDSILQITLDVVPVSYATIEDSFCEGDTYTFNDITTTEPGIFETTILNQAGCDSIILLELTSIAPSTGIQVIPQVEVLLGETVDINLDYFDPSLIDFSWYTENSVLVSETNYVENYQATENTTLFVEALNDFGCGVVDSIQIIVDKSNIEMYIPNAFTPDANGVNDFFRFYGSIALDEVLTFAVFDRWGNMIYLAEKVNNDPSFRGWNGRFKGKEAATGVYAYYIIARFLDGSEKIFNGDVTLIR